MDEEDKPELQGPHQRPGQRLRHAREAAGLDRAAIAERTKIPERLIQAIEDGNFAAMPARANAASNAPALRVSGPGPVRVTGPPPRAVGAATRLSPGSWLRSLTYVSDRRHRRRPVCSVRRRPTSDVAENLILG